MRAWLFSAVFLLGCGSAPPMTTTSQPDAAAEPDSAMPEPPPKMADAAVEAAPPKDIPYPDPDWATDSAKSQNIDDSFLDQADAIAEKNNSYCLLVIRHGLLVHEK